MNPKSKFKATDPSIYSYDSPNTASRSSSFVREEAYILGKAEFLLEALSDFGPVPHGIREQILVQKSDFQLRRWFRLARQVRTLEEFINRM